MKKELSVENVVYVKHDEKSVQIYMSDGTFFSDDIAYYRVVRMLTDTFIRVNKNVIINLNYARRIDGDMIVLTPDCKFNMDELYKKTVTNEFYKLKLMNFLPN